MKTKVCSKCGERKKVSEFHKDSRLKCGYRADCKECKIKQKHNYYRKYPYKKTLTDIKQRCNNPNNKEYKNYGGRGIKCLITEEEVKRLWFRDKAYLMDKPSIDRINNDGDYTYENCRYVELRENVQKQDKTIFKRKIFQYNYKSDLINIFNSSIEAEERTGISRSNIVACCNNRRKSAGKFIWKHEEEF